MAGEDGAPFIDSDRDGTYNPAIDIPGFDDADQTVWYVANDLDSTKTINLYGSLPIGIELQVTVWGYNSTTSSIGYSTFRKYKLINKSGNEIKDMYAALWSDIDDGAANDDFAGCDTTLDLGYVYNAIDTDGVYGSTPPAVGFSIMQGPIVNGNANDVANYSGKIIRGKRNLHMTSSVYFACGDSLYYNPIQGNYNGTLAWYNYMQGRTTKTGELFKIPQEFGGGSTTFTLSGDPVTGKGWIDGIGQHCGDRNITIASGPFNMAAGDTQEVVFANVVGMGTDRLNSISIMKFYNSQIQKSYYDMVKNVILPNDFELFQNYPNPFNPTTIIKYQIPKFGLVQLKIYDVLGREIVTLVNEVQSPGNYSVQFGENVNHRLTSGIYFYTLKAGNFVQARKMILLK
ncbi:MAG: T9SS type A sorting domain-containing protein [Bacteroidetes bacterium]|nr:T9SS type A sorting domain-containing protein [Bacteroidota bacterium]